MLQVEQNFGRTNFHHASERQENIKSVQTSFSSVDLTKKKCSCCQRKIRSQEDIRKNQKDIKLQNEVLEWLRESYSREVNTKSWGEKMQRLASKLTKPGGEERIRQKIQKYLKRVPSPFSDCDEDRKEFRDQLPDNIIKILKKMYLKPEKRRNYQNSPVKILRIEIPKYQNDYDNGSDVLKYSVDNWLNDVPVKKKDFLGRSIRKEDVLGSIMTRIEPYLSNRHDFDEDYKTTLKLIILEVLSEIPMDIDKYEKICHLNRLATSLVNDIVNIYAINHNCDGIPHNSQPNFNTGKIILKMAEIASFVKNETTNIINKLHLSISTKRLPLLESELKDMLLDAMSDLGEIDNTTKENIFIVLHNLGGLTDYQAKYFSNIILNHFKKEFCDLNKDGHKQAKSYLNQSKSLTGVPYSSNTFSVFHHTPVKSNLKHTISSNKNSFFANDQEVNIYTQKLIKEIDEWLQNLDVQIPFQRGARMPAIKDLAEDIIDRFKYIEINPINRASDENEVQYLKYQIFKWINKVAGENTIEIIEHANELMERIHRVSTLTNKKSNDDLTLSCQLITKNENQRGQLKEIISIWFKGRPIGVDKIRNNDELIMNLVRNLEYNMKIGKDVHAVINNEVDAWVKTEFGNKNNLDVGKLKEALKSALCVTNSNITNADSKRERIFIRKYEDIIDEWIDATFIEMFGDTLHFDNKNELIHYFSVNIFDILNGDKKSESDTATYLRNVMSEWFQNMPLCLCMDKEEFQSKCVNKLIESILRESQIEQDQSKLRDDLVSSSTQINLNELAIKIDHENSNSYERSKINGLNQPKLSNITIYDVSVSNMTEDGNNTTNSASIKQIKESDLDANLQFYLRQLIKQIDEWLSSLKLPQIHDNGFKDIVINDLAGDIIDHHKYLELNPLNRGTEEDELKQLKYQIFKWINKLVGDEQQETVDRASELMDRIRNIPVPMLMRHNEEQQNNKYNESAQTRAVSKLATSSSKGTQNMSPESNTKTRNNCDRCDISNIKSKTATSPSNVRLSSPLGFTTGPMGTINQNRIGRNVVEAKVNMVINDTKCSARCDTNDTSKSETCPEDPPDIPPGLSLDEVYPFFDDVFKQQIQEIPIKTPNAEQKLLADMARKGLYNGIWKTYFQLKADPEIENDYSYFELIFEEQIDKMLDCLPQTEDMRKLRPAWKSKLLINIMAMLKYVHSISDSPSFRQKIAEKIDRKLLKAHYQECSNLHQHGFVVRTADAYILYSKYKEEDPVKANIYRQRLMKRIEELAESVKRQNNVEFRFINQAQLCQIAMQLLDSEPIPQDEALEDEVNEILLGEEIEEWYNELPVQPIRNETDEILRKRMRELLAKKLYELEKSLDDDSTAEMNIKHEVSKFLHEKAGLQENEDLNINFMVDELTNRFVPKQYNQNNCSREVVNLNKYKHKCCDTINIVVLIFVIGTE